MELFRSTSKVHFSFAVADIDIKDQILAFISNSPDWRFEITFSQIDRWILDNVKERDEIVSSNVVVVILSSDFLNSINLNGDFSQFVAEILKFRKRLVFVLASEIPIYDWFVNEVILPKEGPITSYLDKRLAYEEIFRGITSLIEVQQNKKAIYVIEKEWEDKSGQLELVGFDLRQIPVDLLRMDWLHTIALSRNRIAKIEHLPHTKQLAHLDLSDNQILKIENLDQVSSLRVLYLDRNQVISIDGLEPLEQLERLELPYNDLSEITAIGKNKNLKALGLSNNRLTSLDGIQQLDKLEILYAAHNELEDIEPLRRLSLLQRVVLTSNRIRSIKPLLSHIKAGLKVAYEYSFTENASGIFLKDNTSLNEPSVEVIQSGRAAVLKYFKDASKYEVQKLEIVKLILVGNSRVGKTNLSEFLRKKEVQLKSNSTHLLDIQGWDAPFLVSDDKTLTHVKIFDFGGQDYYHDAHRMYYSHDTAYLLLWDTSSNKYSEEEDTHPKTGEKILYENFPLEYWLESINYNMESKNLPFYKADDGSLVEKPKGKSVPVMIIQNKIDVEEGKLDQKCMVDKYQNIWGFFNLSVSTQKRTAILYEVLSDYFHALDLTGRRLIRFEIDVVNHFMKSQEPLRILSLEEFRLQCIDIIYQANSDLRKDASFVFNNDNAVILAQILNNIGIILFEKTAVNDGLIYSNISQLNQLVKEVMEEARAGNDKGVFSRNQVKSIEHRDAVIDLLQRNNSIIRINEDEFLAPQFLPTTSDPSIQFFLHSFSYTQMRFVYKAYFHKTLLLNLFSKYLKDEHIDTSSGVKRFPFWRNGIIVKRGDEASGTVETVLVEFEKNAEMGIVNIRTMRPFSKTGLEREIEQTLDELNKGWTVEKQVSVDSKHFFSVDYLKTESENKQYSFTHLPDAFNTEKLTWAKWQAFLLAISTASSTTTSTLPFIPRKNFSINDFKHIVDFKQLPKKLFISYSSRNAAFVKRFVTHLEVLKANGLIDPWYDRMIESGTRWDDTIRAEMGKSDVVIFLLSPDFLATEYIMKEEVPLAIKQFQGDTSKFFFVQLLPCSWEKTDLSKFQQTDNSTEVAKNVISIDTPDNDKNWTLVINELEAKLAPKKE